MANATALGTEPDHANSPQPAEPAYRFPSYRRGL
jgi:hypothetical protein